MRCDMKFPFENTETRWGLNDYSQRMRVQMRCVALSSRFSGVCWGGIGGIWTGVGGVFVVASRSGTATASGRLWTSRPSTNMDEFTMMVGVF